ncbi:hypothetical protein V6N12_067716 [Hibiscus sabdariffa]|uniref:Uncharacterized protein n=1 Tax=Hibiscus sabdariffa TaxID=183260 RepID=A0ABR2A0X9_9ROSI
MSNEELADATDGSVLFMSLILEIIFNSNGINFSRSISMPVLVSSMVFFILQYVREALECVKCGYGVYKLSEFPTIWVLETIHRLVHVKAVVVTLQL